MGWPHWCRRSYTRMRSRVTSLSSAAARGIKRHSAYRSQFLVVKYPWHPLYGKRVPLNRRAERRDCNVVHVEVRDGLSRELPAWMFDASVCVGMKLGPPQVSAEALTTLREALSAQRELGAAGRSSGCSGEEGQSDEAIVKDFKEATSARTVARRPVRTKRGTARGGNKGSGRPTTGSDGRKNGRTSIRRGRRK